MPQNPNTSYSDGFEVIKSLGRNHSLKDKVKTLAVNDTFWLRPSSVARSVAVDTWNVVVKGKLGGLEELVVVFSAGGENLGRGVRRGVHSDGQGNGETVRGMEFETIGWYKEGAREGEVGRIQRRCDDFLRVYLGYFPADKRKVGMRIRYVVVC